MSSDGSPQGKTESTTENTETRDEALRAESAEDLRIKSEAMSSAQYRTVSSGAQNKGQLSLEHEQHEAEEEERKEQRWNDRRTRSMYMHAWESIDRRMHAHACTYERRI